MPKVPIASAERYAKDIIKALADNGCEIRLTNTYELYVRDQHRCESYFYDLEAR